MLSYKRVATVMVSLYINETLRHCPYIFFYSIAKPVLRAQYQQRNKRSATMPYTQPHGHSESRILKGKESKQ